MKYLLLTFMLIYATSALGQNIPTSLEKPTYSYTFGVVPQQSAYKLAQMWTPVLQHISAQTGIALKFVTAKDIPSFEEALAQGHYDIAYMNPYHYTVFHDKSGYVPLVRDVKKPLQGIIVTRRDSQINDISQLHGLTLAFPAPTAFAASIIPRAELNHAGVSITPRYVHSHDSVYLSVIKGLFTAGGGIMRSLEHLPAEQRAELKVLWRSQQYTGHAIAAHSDVPDAHRQHLIRAFSQLDETEQGRTLLEQLNFNQLQAAANEDWDDVRALGIHSLSRPHY
ncbi:phosphate/phosphite/phosphonate ABC transporter substrate-binding protein [Alteromonas gilva]|uniref:Phosphate/phosphite/phosphonate ABC transporter substrate-binding protein n=1 Tax=Alteromonas gilva TaxID=2987522 RepID=A0ABT5L5Q6_9ALTE|nr:phosphate/phosphite/phosphonate ABC transporter substrate-binding protein [Alteromonas gilva]MDC8832375.1 phosphate/phosphite/phosphonate ABC transporter substrate-binding protein [Alteromonas gilva]